MSCKFCGAVAIPDKDICPECLVEQHPGNEEELGLYPRVDEPITEDILEGNLIPIIVDHMVVEEDPTTDISNDEIEQVFQCLLQESCKGGT